MQLKDFDTVIANEHGITKAKARDIIRTLEGELRKQFIFGAEVNIFKIGKFELVKRQAKDLNDVRTGQKVHYPKHYKLVFRVSPQLQAKIRLKKVF